MTYTTDQAIALAREVHAGVSQTPGFDIHFGFGPKELTAFANAVRRETLLEAADKAGMSEAYSAVLRRMAEGE